jgi:hypothetical protein
LIYVAVGPPEVVGAGVGAGDVDGDGVLAVGLPVPLEPLPVVLPPLPLEPLVFEPPTIAGTIATVEPGSGTATGVCELPTGELGKLGPVGGTRG